MSTSPPRVDTSAIGPLQEILNWLSTRNIVIGGFFRFSVVIDANAVIADLIYRSRHPDRGPTAFEELVRATILVPHAPRWLETEMESAIPQAAAKRSLAEATLWEWWHHYRSLLVWHDTPAESNAATGDCWDPKDRPYVLLESKLRADGILTKDADIARMGGHPLSLDFVLSTREYARASVVTVSLRVYGVLFPAITLMALAGALRGIANKVAALPPAVKAVLIAAGIIALAHPESRRWIGERCVDVGVALSSTWQSMSEIVGKLAALDNSAQLAANASLAIASGLVKPKPVLLRRRRVKRPRKARVRQQLAQRLSVSHGPANSAS
jgi:hypothetical protein